MDPDRVRAYLQISCAGLGFDIGELWWTSNKDGGSSSAIAAIGTFASSSSNEESLLSKVPSENWHSRFWGFALSSRSFNEK